jgi:hypothetical protein
MIHLRVGVNTINAKNIEESERYKNILRNWSHFKDLGSQSQGEGVCNSSNPLTKGEIL